MVLAVRLARRFVRPHLARTADPVTAEAAFRRAAALFRPPPFLRRSATRAGGAALHWIAAGPVVPDALILWFHGGAMVSGGPWTHAAMLGRLARLARVEVCAPRYRLLQEAPFPAACDDALTAWEALMARGTPPGRIVIGGDSAGGNLALGLLAQVLARGERPAGLLLFSPWADLTRSGSRGGTAQDDPVLPVERMAEVRDLYLAGADPADPRASPVLADFAGAPPALIQVGTQEVLRTDAEAVAARLRAGGGAVQLDLWPGCMHVWQMGDGLLPESRAALRDAARFVQAVLAPESR